MIMGNWFTPKPRQLPKRLPRRKPIKVVPSGIGDEGIVGDWLFYYLKGGDHLHDFSPEKNHGTIHGAKWVDGRYGWALDFDGVDDYVDIPDSIPVGKNITVLVWAKSDTTTWNDYGWMASSRSANGFVVHPFQDTKDVNMHVYNDAGVESTGARYTVSDITQWHLYGLEYNDGTNEIWTIIDGDIVFKNSFDITRASDIIPAQIGLDTGGTGGRYGKGSIAIVRIYNRALSAKEIQAYYNRTKGIFGV